MSNSTAMFLTGCVLCSFDHFIMGIWLMAMSALVVILEIKI